MTILNLNSDILTPPSLTLNTFGTMQPVIKAILLKKCSQQLLYGFPYEATIAIQVRVQEFSSRRVDSTDTPSAKENFDFPWFQRGSINSSRGEDGVQLFPGVGGRGGVSRCLIIPYLIPYNLYFLRGSGLPSGSKHAMLGLSGCCDKS